MKQFKKAGILIIFGVLIILVREYEWKEKISQTPEIWGQAELVRVVDGDTVVVNLAGKEEKIRIIGINTPESVKPHSPVECFGKEAAEHITELLSQKKVLKIETDPTQDTRDRHGRLLAHIFIDEVNIAEHMISDGYAYEYTYRDPYIYQTQYKDVENQARRLEKGLWSPKTCNGKK